VIPVPDEAIHLIDFAAWQTGSPTERKAVASQIDRACRETGFLRVRNHGIPLPQLQELQEITRRYFDLDAATKLGHIYQPKHGNRGYAPFGGENLAATYGESEELPDLFEAFTIGPVGRPADAYHQHADAGRFFEPNLFPAAPADFESQWTGYYRAAEILANDLMDAFAAALGLELNFFAPFVDRHITAMRALHYPALTQAPKPGQFRIGAHSDFGSLTILLSDGTPGLQVKRNGEWSDVVIGPGELLVNIGDLMADWTGGRWKSTLHRVVPSAPDRDRLTITFFHHPNYDAVVSALPSLLAEGAEQPRLVTAGQYLEQKLAALQLTDKT
jgi:isopenicillin N synthase-like dioxygenase